MEANTKTVPTKLDLNELQTAFSNSKRAFFFLDYDGTLSPLVKEANRALPSDEVLNALKNLSADPKVVIYIVSGRDRKALMGWLGHLPLGFSCEHGCFLRLPPSPNDPSEQPEWRDMIVNSQDSGDVQNWKDALMGPMRDAAGQVPGSSIEKKEYAFTWHYRQAANKAQAKAVSRKLFQELKELEKRFPRAQVVKGKKSIEVRPSSISKGIIIQQILALYKDSIPDFIFCAGDDVTDEDMFSTLSNEFGDLPNVFSVTVGCKLSNAPYCLKTQPEVVSALSMLAEECSHSGQN
jgi:trehalose 6-phosphate synthase/phosphatase